MTHATQVSLLGDSKLETGGEHLERQTGDKFYALKIEFVHGHMMGWEGGFGNRKSFHFISLEGSGKREAGSDHEVP